MGSAQSNRGNSGKLICLIGRAQKSAQRADFCFVPGVGFPSGKFPDGNFLRAGPHSARLGFAKIALCSGLRIPPNNILIN